jgi:hypothetical protein
MRTQYALIKDNGALKLYLKLHLELYPSMPSNGIY